MLKSNVLSKSPRGGYLQDQREEVVAVSVQVVQLEILQILENRRPAARAQQTLCTQHRHLGSLAQQGGSDLDSVKAGTWMEIKKNTSRVQIKY